MLGKGDTLERRESLGADGAAEGGGWICRGGGQWSAWDTGQEKDVNPILGDAWSVFLTTWIMH